ncbi:RidA family protein [Oricola cellulosilytica]|uniref:RidA family protein n=1 Tax=Oricola cellulosilytica TaxID=1429082 RepID=A0A4R0PAL2_9HYPH|nr:RidA family protein [Oricola cellulosilytica]TCD13217.1 RidA family protein [Oricola cellulosilytica]
MSSTIESRLQEHGIALPAAAAPAANYVPAVQSGSFLYTSGQLPLRDGKLVSSGLLGRDLDVDQGREAAKWCAVNVLAQARSALGDLGKIKRIVKITVFVASSPDFTEQHLVANGASDFLVDILGDAGRHARSAVGMACLPLNAPVEIEAIIES